MNRNEKIGIIFLIIILVVTIIIFASNKNKNTSEAENLQNVESANIKTEEYVKITKDGTKVNTSEKANQTKNVNGFEFKDIQITEKSGQTVLLATVTNKTSNETKTTLVDVVFLDKQGKEIVTVGGIIAPLKAGESTQFNSTMTLDYSNVYDFQIKIK